MSRLCNEVYGMSKCIASYIRVRQMVREHLRTVHETNARMCRWDCKPVLRHPEWFAYRLP